MTPDRPIRLAVLISGGGTTFVNFRQAIAAGQLQAEIPLVIASRRDCGGIAKAEQAGIRCVVLPRKDFPTAIPFMNQRWLAE
jgi:phosphoribosylglycinamide formyltransferase-1